MVGIVGTQEPHEPAPYEPDDPERHKLRTHATDLRP